MNGTIAYIYRMIGDLNRYGDKASKVGFKEVGSAYQERTFEKDGITIKVYTYDYRNWHASNVLTYKGHTFDTRREYLTDDVAELVALGFDKTYERTAKDLEIIATIKKTYQDAYDIVDRRGLGELGGVLRSRGYYMNYDGFSCSTFSKGCLLFNAHSTDREWKIVRCNVYLADDTLTDDFKIEELDEKYELLFGSDAELGHRFTEKERVQLGMAKYTKYRVRVYSNKEITTIEWFDNFEDAKKCCDTEAKNRYDNVPEYNHRWRCLRDVSDKYDYLYAICYYAYDGQDRALVWVQGEYE